MILPDFTVSGGSLNPLAGMSRLGFSACPILPAAGENFENLALETRRFHKTAFDRIGVGRSERGFALSLDQMHAHSTP